jgi:ribokinase
MTGERVLVLGALHHDVVVDAPRLPAVDETLPGTGVDYRFGGKGGNQAVAAARMGAEVSMAGRVGRDEAALAILSTLDAVGVDRSLVLETDASTGMSVAITLPSGDYGAVIVSGANLENDGEVAFQEAPATVLLQNEIPEAANLALVRKLPPETRLIVNAAPARPLSDELGARTDVLIVNRVEAEGMTGLASPEDAVRALAEKVRGAVVLTRGADGALLAEGGQVAGYPTVPVTVVSTHGAGDMFTGALAARLTAGHRLEDALSFAQAAAGLYVSLPIAQRDQISAAAVAGYLAY